MIEELKKQPLIGAVDADGDHKFDDIEYLGLRWKMYQTSGTEREVTAVVETVGDIWNSPNFFYHVVVYDGKHDVYTINDNDIISDATFHAFVTFGDELAFCLSVCNEYLTKKLLTKL